MGLSSFNTNGDTIVARTTGPQGPQRAVELEVTHEAPLSTLQPFRVKKATPRAFHSMFKKHSEKVMICMRKIIASNTNQDSIRGYLTLRAVGTSLGSHYTTHPFSA